MKKRLVNLCLVSCLFTTINTYAFHFDESKQSLQLGGALNTGNSETTNITSTFTNEWIYGKFSSASTLDGQLATSKGIESARSLKGSGNVNYTISEMTYSFVKGSVNYDKFATYDFLIREAIGLGRYLIKTEKHVLSIESGPGAIHRRVAGTEEFQNSPILNIAAIYQTHISETASFKQTFSTDIAKISSHLEATSAITTTIINNLALELSFTISHDTTIPAFSVNTKKTDTASKATIVYTFSI